MRGELPSAFRFLGEVPDYEAVFATVGYQPQPITAHRPEPQFVSRQGVKTLRR